MLIIVITIKTGVRGRSEVLITVTRVLLVVNRPGYVDRGAG